jgi:hypothetical protein
MRKEQNPTPELNHDPGSQRQDEFVRPPEEPEPDDEYPKPPVTTDTDPEHVAEDIVHTDEEDEP